MKTSNKILLGVGISIPVIIVILPLIVLRIVLGQNLFADRVETLKQENMTREFMIKDFSGIHVAGHWDIRIQQGENYAITIESLESVLDVLSVEKKRNQLELILSDVEHPHQIVKVIATITLPSLSSLELEGLNRVHLAGFSSEQLSIHADGHTTITGKKNILQNFHLKSEGFVAMNLEESPVTNAELECNGWVKIRLFMAGGTLSGLIDGFGKVVYDGEVKEYTLERNIWE